MRSGALALGREQRYPVVMEIWAAVAGGAITLAGVALTLWWTGRSEQSRLDQEQLATIRSEKRRIYAEVIRSIGQFREAAFDIGHVRKKDRDWQRYWATRERCLDVGAELQLIGSYQMLDSSSEAVDLLYGIGFQFFEHPDLNPSMQNYRTIAAYVASHTTACDHESDRLIDLMRVDLGYSPLAPAIEEERQRVRQQADISALAPGVGTEGQVARDRPLGRIRRRLRSVHWPNS